MSTINGVHSTPQLPTLRLLAPTPGSVGGDLPAWDQVLLDPEAFEPESMGPSPVNFDHYRDGQNTVSRSLKATKKIEGAMAEEGADRPVKGLARKVGRVTGPLSIAFGAQDVAEGVQQLQEGKTVEGGLKTTQGATTTASGVANTAKYWGPVLSNSAGASTAVSVASKAAGPLGAIGAGIDSVTDFNEGLDFRDGVKVKNSEKVATGTVKAASAGLMAAGLVFPPAAVAGAALYAGVTIYENREAIGKALHQGGKAIEGGLAKGGEMVRGGLTKGGQVVKGGLAKAGEATKALPEPARKAVDTVKKGVGKLLGQKD